MQQLQGRQYFRPVFLVQIGDVDYPYAADFLVDERGFAVASWVVRSNDAIAYVHGDNWELPLTEEEVAAIADTQLSIDNIILGRHDRKRVRIITQERIPWGQTILYGFVATFFGSLLALTLFQVLIGF